MNCQNCGAAMEPVESRRYFRCPHCGSYRFPDGPEADGIRVLGTSPSAPNCPVCSLPMAHALLEVHPIDCCTTCRGVLLPRETYAAVVNKRRAWATTPPAEPVPIDTASLQRVLTCPKCGHRFDTYPNYGPGNVVIDSCTNCDSIWLDFGEMQQIVDAPGRDRGGQHVPRIDDEYIRQGPPRDREEESGALPGGRPDVLRLLLDLWFGT